VRQGIGRGPYRLHHEIHGGDWKDNVPNKKPRYQKIDPLNVNSALKQTVVATLSNLSSSINAEQEIAEVIEIFNEQADNWNDQPSDSEIAKSFRQIASQSEKLATNLKGLSQRHLRALRSSADQKLVPELIERLNKMIAASNEAIKPTPELRTPDEMAGVDLTKPPIPKSSTHFDWSPVYDQLDLLVPSGPKQGELLRTLFMHVLAMLGYASGRGRLTVRRYA